MKRSVRLFASTLLFVALAALSASAQSQLKQLSAELVQITEKLTPSVVAIEIPPAAPQPAEPDAANERFRGWFAPQPVLEATGVIMSPDGTILTAGMHFAGRREAEVKVKLADGREFPGKLVGKDLRTGLAVVKIDAAGLTAVKLATTPIRAGSLAVALTCRPQLGPAVALTTIAGTDRVVTGGTGMVGTGTQYTGLLQVSGGFGVQDLGGLVADLDGNMIGMLHSTMGAGPRMPVPMEQQGQAGVRVFTMQPSAPGGGDTISFAIPADVIARVIVPLKRGEQVKWGYLGVFYAYRKDEGIVVSKVMEDGPGAKAGLLAQDVVRKVRLPDGETLDLAKDPDAHRHFADKIGWAGPDRKVTLEINRGGEAMTLEVALGTAPEPQEPQGIMPGQPMIQRFRIEGDRVVPEEVDPRELLDQLRGQVERARPAMGARLGVEGEAAEGGVRIAAVQENTPAAKADLRAGDLLHRVGDTPVATPEALAEAVAKHKPGDKVSIAITRNGAEMVVEVTVDSAPARRMFRLPRGAFLGIQGEDMGDGLRVTEMVPASPADKAGLKVGDVIVRADEKNVAGLSDLRDVIRAHKPEDRITIGVKRDGKDIDLAVTLGSPPGVDHRVR